MADLGKLVIEMTANVTRLQGDMDKAVGVVRQASGKIQSLSGLATKALGLVGAGFAGWKVAGALASTIELADQLEGLAGKTGIAIETLSGLKFAAEQSDTSFEALIGGLNRLNKTLSQAASGSKEAREALVGISSRDTVGALLELADQVQSTGANAETAARLMTIFGRSAGPELLPLLSQGADGIRELIAENQRLGGQITTETAQAISDYKDNLNALAVAVRGVSIEVVSRASPAMVQITNAVREAAKEAGVLQAAWVALGGLGAAIFTDEFVPEIEKAQQRIAELGEQMAEIDQRRAEVDQGMFRNSRGAEDTRTRLSAQRAEAQAEIEALQARIKAIQDAEAAEAQRRQAAEQAKAAAQDAAQAMLEQQREEQRSADEAARAAERAAQSVSRAHEAKAEAVTRSIAQLQEANERLRLGEDGAAIATARRNGATEQQIRLMQSLIDERNLLADIEAEYVERAKASEEAERELARAAEEQASRLQTLMEATPSGRMEALRQDVYLLRDAFVAGSISVDEFGEAVRERMDGIGEQAAEAQSAMTTFAEQAGRNIQDAFADFLFNPFEGGMKGMVRGFADALRRMAAEAIAARLANNLLELGTSLSGGGGVMGFIGSALTGLFGGGKAAGGPVSAGTTYLVGERGPELLTMRSAGYVTPAPETARILRSGFGGGRASGGPVMPGMTYLVGEQGPELLAVGGAGRVEPMGGKTTITNNVEVTVNADGGGNARGDRAEAAELGRRIESAVRGVLVAERRPGGLLAT